MKPRWLPVPGRDIPTGFETPRLRVRMLTVHDAVKDYDAVMTSRAQLRGVFPGSDWPRDDLTLEQDLIDLAWHQKEFQIGSSYTHTVVAPDESLVSGCLYLFQPTRPGCEADLIAWVRSDERATGLETHLWAHLDAWLRDAWGFARLHRPGIDPPEWRAPPA